MPTEGPAPGGGLRVAVVGPTQPYKGGVAAHTTELAHRLAAAGHDTVLIVLSSLIIASMALLADLVVRSRGDLVGDPDVRAD